MRFLTETFQLPHNLEQQLERNVASIQVILGSLALIFAVIVMSQLAGFEALATTNVNVVIGVLFIVLALMGMVEVARKKNWLAYVLPMGVIFPLFATAVAYNNGYLPFAFMFPVLPFAMLTYRGRFRLLLPYLILVAWSVAEHFSPVQAAEQYVLRLQIVAVVLIYPLHVWIEADQWDQALKLKLLKVVLFQAVIAALYLGLARIVSGDVESIYPSLVSALVFTGLYVAITKGWMTPVKKLLVALVLLSLYWFLVSKNGVLPAMLLVGFAMFYFLLLPAFDALMLSIAILVVSMLGINNAAYIDFPLTPFVSRHAVASLITMTVFYLLFKQGDQKQALSFSAILKALPIALGITLGSVALQLPEFQEMRFGASIDQAQLRTLIGTFTLFVLLTWITSRYWHNQQSLQRTLNELSAAEHELAVSLSQARKQTQQMELMAEGGKVGFFEVDLTDGTMRGNTTLMARENLPVDAVVSMEQVTQNVPEAARDAFQQDVQAAIEAGPGAVTTFTHPYVTASGEYIFVRVIATTQLRGEKLLALGASIDITEELEAKNNAEQAARALELEQDRQKQMFAVISHEIRTPAASLNMLIHNKGITAEDPSDAEKMAEISDHLVSVLDDLRFVIKPDQAKGADEKTVKLFITIDKIASSLSVMLEQNRQAIKTISQGQLPSVLKFNVQLVRQIVTNLVKNASIHSGASEIVLRLSASEQSGEQWMVFVQVEDNGRGIAPSDQGKMFEAFARGSTQADGTGLGLYIAREYANQLGGDLTYQLREGGGSVFTLSFKAKQVAKVEAPEVEHALSASIQGKQVLLAEDNKTIQMMTEIILQKGGASVEVADDGVEALALVKESPDKYDFVITDIMMPNMNGYELTRELREFGFSKPIIGVTAAVIGEESDELLAMGADQVIEKPVDLAKLNAAYAACIQSADAEGSAEQQA